jgi:hypothetical protein
MLYRRYFSRRMGEQGGGVEEQVLHHDPLNADQVYILMKKEYRISRNVRAQWFCDHLNRVIHLDASKKVQVLISYHFLVI